MKALTPDSIAASIGQEVALSQWTEITQERIDAFAAATGDHQFIHVDPEQAAAGPFGTTIAHGFLTLSMLAGEFRNTGGAPQIEGARMVINYGLNRVRFITPVRSGVRLRNRAVLQSAEQGDGYLQLVIVNTIEIEGQPRPACTAESISRVYL